MVFYNLVQHPICQSTNIRILIANNLWQLDIINHNQKKRSIYSGIGPENVFLKKDLLLNIGPFIETCSIKKNPTNLQDRLRRIGGPQTISGFFLCNIHVKPDINSYSEIHARMHPNGFTIRSTCIAQSNI